MSIFIYGIIRCKYVIKDPFMKKLYINGSKLYDLDGWSLLHFTSFAIISFVYPTKFITIQAFGISWELFEQVLGKYRPSFLGGFGNCDELLKTDQNTNEWWYGRLSDIFMNLSGGLFGLLLSKYY